MNAIIIILIVSAMGILWLDNVRTREQAIAICQRLCKQHHVQLLDQTVAISSLGLRFASVGLRIYRVYVFELSADGINRRKGFLTLLGKDLEVFSLPAEVASESDIATD